ncbi:hypothetical protein Salat_0615200 [Sesamum alatum]|uniref:Uncharacterized protein n=1 Tax=Sesamum alatum TaxID=300844 RepID=A0AAE2CUF3_9LAMI|nr:hypothetical protein Salat_0615200 [Sesamum alatum]
MHPREQGRVEPLLPEHNTELNTVLANCNRTCCTWTLTIVTGLMKKPKVGIGSTSPLVLSHEDDHEKWVTNTTCSYGRDPLPSIPLPDPARFAHHSNSGQWWLQAPTTDAEPDDRPAPPPPAPSHAVGSSRGPRPDASTADALQKNPRQAAQLLDGQTQLQEHRPTTWPTSSNACTIGS